MKRIAVDLRVEALTVEATSTRTENLEERHNVGLLLRKPENSNAPMAHHTSKRINNLITRTLLHAMNFDIHYLSQMLNDIKDATSLHIAADPHQSQTISAHGYMNIPDNYPIITNEPSLVFDDNHTLAALNSIFCKIGVGQDISWFGHHINPRQYFQIAKQWPQTLLCEMQGKPLEEYIVIPALADMGLIITRTTSHTKFTRIHVR